MTAGKKGRFSQHIPAVSRFAESAGAAVESEVVPFDRWKVDRYLRCAISLISISYPQGAWEWLKAHKAEILSSLKKYEDAVDEAILQEDFGLVLNRLAKCSEAYFRAWEVFKLRPPVIDRG